MTRQRMLFGATVVLAVVAAAGCCKKKTDDSTAQTTDDAAPTATATDTAAAQINPDWKTKCPQADRPEGGTAIALRDIGIHPEPDQNVAHKAGIPRGTFVNVLGVKGTWYCVDYPCTERGLCPGWVEQRDIEKRYMPIDAGYYRDAAVTVEAGPTTVDAAAAAPVDAGRPTITLDAGRTTTPTTTTTTTTTGNRPPPGGRPPLGKLPRQ
jgi:hypothetical protein